MTPRRWLFVLVLLPAVGFAVFGITVSRVTRVERLKLERVVTRADSVRSTFENPTPVVTTDPDGELRVERPELEEPAPIRTLHVLAYRQSLGRLAQTDIPMWFLKLKDPALRFALRETGVDLAEMGLTAADLRRHGPRILLDDTERNGDRILIWTDGSDD